MTNDTSTLNGALQELGETMASNLVDMGVINASASDGLTTLAGKILDIEPSVGGLDLDTSVTLQASSTSIETGQSVVLTSLLTASYDDKTLVNVDLSGVLQGATITFKEGNTVLGTGVTDTNGTATATISGLTRGSHTIKAVFAGTDNFNDCESSTVTVAVTNPPVATLNVASDKSVLSTYDSEKATLTATVLDANNNPLSGETVTFKKSGTTLDTVQTNNNGEASYEYTSANAGDVTFTVECSSLSQTCSIEDIKYYNNGTKTTGITVPTNASCTVDDGSLKITTRTTGEKKVRYPVPFNTDNFIIEFEVAKIGVTQSIALYLKDSTTANGCWFAYNDSTSKWSGGCGSTWEVQNASLTVGDKIKIKQENGVITLYQNNTQLFTKTKSFSGTYYVGHYTNKDRIQYVKNIKVIQL